MSGRGPIVQNLTFSYRYAFLWGGMQLCRCIKWLASDKNAWHYLIPSPPYGYRVNWPGSKLPVSSCVSQCETGQEAGGLARSRENKPTGERTQNTRTHAHTCMCYTLGIFENYILYSAFSSFVLPHSTFPLTSGTSFCFHSRCTVSDFSLAQMDMKGQMKCAFKGFKFLISEKPGHFAHHKISVSRCCNILGGGVRFVKLISSPHAKNGHSLTFFSNK